MQISEWMDVGLNVVGQQEVPLVPGVPAGGAGGSPTATNPGVTGSATPAGTGAPAGASGGGGGAGGMNLIWFMLLIVGVMIFSQVMVGRKEKKKRADLLSNLSTNDKVLTVGGIVGTVAEIREDLVVLRVDETSNTRIQFSKAAVQQVLRSANGKGGTVVESKPGHQKAAV